MDGGNGIAGEVPGSAIDKKARFIWLLVQPLPNFMFFGCQVVPVIHDVLVETFLVTEGVPPEEKSQKNGGNQIGGRVGVQRKFSEKKIGDRKRIANGKRCKVCHGRHHDEGVTLVDFNREIPRNVFENDVCLDVIEQQETGDFGVFSELPVVDFFGNPDEKKCESGKEKIVEA